MTKRPFPKKRIQPPLDLALVIGLIEMIKRLAQNANLRFKFDELKVIAAFEKGARQQAISHIMETMTPSELGWPTVEPAPEKPDLGLKLGELFRAGQPCPMCKHGVLYDKEQRGKMFTRCTKCNHSGEHITLTRGADKKLGDYLIRLRNHQIISNWWTLNDPNPPLYGADAA